jgi:hypothetical protein
MSALPQHQTAKHEERYIIFGRKRERETNAGITEHLYPEE